MKSLIVAFSVVAVGFSTAAVAQTKQEKRSKPEVHNFGEEQVGGRLMGPTYGPPITVRKTGVFENRIKLRQNFNREVEKSVDNL